MRHDIYDITRGTEQFIIIFELLSWSLLNFPMQNILFAWMKYMDIKKYLTRITNYTLLYLTVWESSEALPTTLRYRHLISSSFWLYWTIVTRFSLIGYASRVRGLWTITATSNGSEEKSLYRCRHNASRRNTLTEQDQSTSYLCKYYFFLIVFLSILLYCLISSSLRIFIPLYLLVLIVYFICMIITSFTPSPFDW